MAHAACRRSRNATEIIAPKVRNASRDIVQMERDVLPKTGQASQETIAITTTTAEAKPAIALRVQIGLGSARAGRHSIGRRGRAEPAIDIPEQWFRTPTAFLQGEII
jgi:hypothetical protein